MLLVSWICLFIIGSTASFGVGALSLAWIHCVVLGWLTTTALAFLVHVMPAFTAVEWRFERLARAALWVYAAGVVVLVIGFWLWHPGVLVAGGVTVAAALAAYGFAFVATLANALRAAELVTRAVARAFILVATALALTAILGVAMAISLDRGRADALRFASVHGATGVVGWIALLVSGVSARTFNRLIGRTNVRLAHIASSTAALVGLLLWIAGTLAPLPPMAIAGGAAMVAAALLYAANTLWRLARATAAHRLPREFLLAAMMWLVVAAVLGGATLTGRHLEAAMLFALLVGWVGQTVNAHLMHTGIRLMATMTIDPDDQTEPIELLDRRLGFASFAVNQTAVLLGVAGLALSAPAAVETAAVCGVAAMILMASNVLHAVRIARARPA